MYMKRICDVIYTYKGGNYRCPKEHIFDFSSKKAISQRQSSDKKANDIITPSFIEQSLYTRNQYPKNILSKRMRTGDINGLGLDRRLSHRQKV